ncbi:MAG: rod shape-determining protein RodA [Pseudomonadota bacterium]
MIDRRLVTHFDWLLVILLLLAIGCGAVNLYSAASTFEGSGSPVFLKQIYWFGLGLVVMTAVAMIGHQRLATLAYPFYGLVLASLVAVLLFGRVVGGAQRWLALGPVVVQPSELARLAVILVLAQYFHRRDQAEPYNLRQLIIPAVLMGLPALLILKQPDLGTAVMVLIVGASIILVNGVRLFSLSIATAAGLGILPVVWSLLKGYQKRRIFSFLDPESDPLGASYHLIQSKIAVGSGQFMGKGWMAGTQSQLHFLPEQHTDFAFSVLAEEWGFVGGVIILVVLSAIVYRGLQQALRAKDRLGMLMVVGAIACVFWPTFINVGMVLGLFPVVGIPLPFVSYGGSSLVTTMAALGLIQSVAMRRFVFHRQ